MNQDDLDDYDLVRLVFDLRKDDAFGTVMRGQMHIAHQLRGFILNRAASPNHARCDDLEIDEAARLAIILGLNSEIKPALATLTALQKRFSRKPNMEFGEQEATNFYNTLSPELKSIIREVYEEERAKENLVQFKRQPPAQRLVYFILGIWSAISADRKHAPEAYSRKTDVPRAYVQDLRARQSAFFQMLEQDNDLEMLIRAHIHVEHELREFILAAAPQPAEVKLSEYDYAGTLRLAMTLGLDPALEAGLSAVGKLRNKFAHRLDMKLTDEEAKQIYSTLDPIRKADAQQAWSKTYLLHPDAGRPKELLESLPKDLIATSIAMLWTGLILAHVTLRSDALKSTSAR
jgi:hypothetical protein